jgi:hypothetical protein
MSAWSMAFSGGSGGVGAGPMKAGAIIGPDFHSDGGLVRRFVFEEDPTPFGFGTCSGSDMVMGTFRLDGII